MKYAIVIERTGPDSFCAHCPDIDEVTATGDSVEDAVSGYREALDIYFCLMRKAGREVQPPQTTVETIEVSDVA